MLGIFQRAAQIFQLFLHEETSHRRQVIRHARRASMGAMGAAKSVVDKNIAQLG
jgi:hypothetical protein